MSQKLNEWVSVNKLALKNLQPNGQFEIDGLGKFLLIESKEGKIIDEDFSLFVFEEEFEKIESGAIDYVVFSFGGNFYYCKPKKKQNQYNEICFEPEFNDFKNLGKVNEEAIAEFYHIGIHSEYELMNGSRACEDWVDKAEFYDMKAIGICDRNTLAGTLSFQLACDKKKIKSILGETVVVAYNYDETKDIQETYDLKLYAMNKEGWKNLLFINNKINVEHLGFIPKETLLDNLDGLIIVFGKDSIYEKLINDTKRLNSELSAYPLSRCYYQIDSVVWEDDDMDKKNLENLKTYIKNPIIAPILINDSYYIDQECYVLKDYLNKIDRKAQPFSDNQYFKTINDTFEIFSRWLSNDKLFFTLEEACNNTVRLAEKCDFKIETGLRRLPKYKFCDDTEQLFFELISEGIDKKLADIEDLTPYTERIKTECKLLVDAQLVDFFLILWDIIAWSKKNNITVGAGRGSVGGSLVAYLLDLTSIDPIKYDLLFERFLNEARLSGERAKSADAIPDIDTDFMGDRRQEVKEYMRQRFGQDNVCCVGTYGRMKLKTCVKDFGRIKGLSFDELNFISKEIDDAIEYTFTDFISYAIKSRPLKEFMQKQPEIINLTKFALMQARTASVHASAMIIVPEEDDSGNPMDLYSWMPMKMIDGILVSEWEGKYVERAGFLKEDILGLSQLDKFKDILDLIAKNRNKKIILEEIPMDDKKTYQFFQRGWNEDVFQFGTSGLKNYSIKVQPTNIEHLIAMTALFRPGPMDSNAHNDFAEIKAGKKKPKYDYMLKEVTEKTSGLYIYQEQVMKAMTVLGGFSLVKSDEVRTIIKKFDEKKMLTFQKEFVKGAIKNGCSEAEAERIWKKLLAFSGYGFNRSHAAAYSTMSYWSQYLKVNYALEFWTIALQHAKEVLIPTLISEFQRIKSHGIELTPPDINHSEKKFTCSLSENKIYWAITKIKGVGDVAVDNIIRTRDEGGQFFSFEEFVKRVPKNKVNKKVVIQLILAGCFDSLENINYALDRKKLLFSFFKDRGEDLPEEFSDKLMFKSHHLVLRQKDLTGYGNVDYKSVIAETITRKSVLSKFMHAEEILDNKTNWKECLVGGRLKIIKERNSKNGKMARVYLESNNFLILVTVWNESYKDIKNQLAESVNKLIAITGKIKFDTYSGQNVIFTQDDTQLFIL